MTVSAGNTFDQHVEIGQVVGVHLDERISRMTPPAG
jgi:hypothetical protein